MTKAATMPVRKVGRLNAEVAPVPMTTVSIPVAMAEDPAFRRMLNWYTPEPPREPDYADLVFDKRLLDDPQFAALVRLYLEAHQQLLRGFDTQQGLNLDRIKQVVLGYRNPHLQTGE
jgi:hypothetical protein